jgi:hypothetical protein
MLHTFGLLFQSSSEDPRAAVEASAQVYLCLSTPDSCQGAEGKILLTRQCLSIHELRRKIDRMQKELEYLWHLGRRSFSELEQVKKSQLEQAAS